MDQQLRCVTAPVNIVPLICSVRSFPHHAPATPKKMAFLTFLSSHQEFMHTLFIAQTYKSHLKILSDEQATIIFRNIEELFAVSKYFTMQLGKFQRSDPNIYTAIGPLLLTLIKGIRRPFIRYCANMQNSEKTLQVCMYDPLVNADISTIKDQLDTSIQLVIALRSPLVQLHEYAVHLQVCPFLFVNKLVMK